MLPCGLGLWWLHWLHLHERRVLVLPCGSGLWRPPWLRLLERRAPVMCIRYVATRLVLPPQEVGSCVATWLRPMATPLTLPPQEAGSRAATWLRPVVAPLALPPREASFCVAMWFQGHLHVIIIDYINCINAQPYVLWSFRQCVLMWCSGAD
jgi:hypothetical protein